MDARDTGEKSLFARAITAEELADLPSLEDLRRGTAALHGEDFARQVWGMSNPALDPDADPDFLASLADA